MDTERIPVLDMRRLQSSDPHEAIQRLGQGLERYGFVAIDHHGIPVPLLRSAYQQARALFGLPAEVKRSYEDVHGARQRGYTSIGVEHAKDSELPDLKEFWHIGRDLPAEHPLHLSGEVPPNRYPQELEDFRLVFQDLFQSMERFSNQLLEAVGTYLGYPAGFFEEMVQDGNSILRIIHYPDLGEAAYPPGSVRASAHEDINLITVLPASTRPGLELLTREGKWLPVDVPPDVMICDTGDMMQLLTGGRLPSTTHRVVNPSTPDGGRLSMPFFLHPHPHRQLRSPQGEGSDILARDFLHQRLVEIGIAS